MSFSFTIKEEIFTQYRNMVEMSLKLIGEKLANLCRDLLFAGANCQPEHLQKQNKKSIFMNQ
jgi:hypothetical protein